MIKTLLDFFKFYIRVLSILLRKPIGPPLLNMRNESKTTVCRFLYKPSPGRTTPEVLCTNVPDASQSVPDASRAVPDASQSVPVASQAVPDAPHSSVSSPRRCARLQTEPPYYTNSLFHFYKR